MKRTRWLPTVVIVVGVALLAGAAIWRAVAVPALVLFPLDADVTPRYEGTLAVYVNPAGLAPLPDPLQVPLHVERHIRADADRSSADRVVIEESIAQEAGTVLNATERSTYVMDRRTLVNVADDRAWAFTPANVVDRSGAYRISLPFGFDPTRTYPIYNNWTGSTYEIRRDPAQPSTEEDGLHVERFVASGDELPLTDAFVTELSRSAPLPRSATPVELSAQLQAAGIDLDALVGALEPVIRPEDRIRLTTLPVPLHYVVSFDGVVTFEPATGALVHARERQTIGVRPDRAALATLRDIVDRYPAVAPAASAAAALDRMAAAPAIRVIELGFDQTPASVADISATVGASRGQVLAATTYVPAGLAAAGAVIVVAGLSVLARRHRRRRARPGGPGEPEEPADPDAPTDPDPTTDPDAPTDPDTTTDPDAPTHPATP